jgi:anti-anti-sigma factor
VKVVCATEDGRPVIRVRGEIDHAGAPRLLRTALASITRGELPVLIDLSECPYMDSGGIGGLRVDSTFRIYDDTAAALLTAWPAGDGSC